MKELDRDYSTDALYDQLMTRSQLNLGPQDITYVTIIIHVYVLYRLGWKAFLR